MLRLGELIDKCMLRGPVMDVEIRSYLNGKIIASVDRFAAEELYGERVVVKHRRNKTKLTVLIV